MGRAVRVFSVFFERFFGSWVLISVVVGDFEERVLFFFGVIFKGVIMVTFLILEAWRFCFCIVWLTVGCVVSCMLGGFNRFFSLRVSRVYRSVCRLGFVIVGSGVWVVVCVEV